MKVILLFMAVAAVRGIVYDLDDDSQLYLATLTLVNQGGYCSDDGPAWLLPNIQAIFDGNSAAQFFFEGDLIGIGGWAGTGSYAYISTFDWSGGCATSAYKDWFEVTCDCNGVSMSSGYDSGLANVICTPNGWGKDAMCSGRYKWVVTTTSVGALGVDIGFEDDHFSVSYDDAGEDDAAITISSEDGAAKETVDNGDATASN